MKTQKYKGAAILFALMILGLVFGTCDNGTGSFSQTVIKPFALPAGEAYEKPQIVTLRSVTSGTTIHYTLDNSDPGPNSTRYISPIVISSSCVLRAAAFKTGMNGSEILTETYTIASAENPDRAELAAFEPNRGSIMANGIRVTTFPEPMKVRLDKAVPFDTEIEISTSSPILLVNGGKVIVRAGEIAEYVYFTVGEIPGPVIVTAKLNSEILQATVNVNEPMPGNITLDPETVSVEPGSMITMQLGIDRAAPLAGFPIALKAEAGVMVPAMVTIPAKMKSVSFNVRAGTEESRVMIRAASASPALESNEAAVMIAYKRPGSLAIKPPVILIDPGKTIVLSVNLDVPIPLTDEPILVNLFSGSGGFAEPSSVLIEPGSSSANFSFIAGPDLAEGVIIVASAQGMNSGTAAAEIAHSPKLVISQIFGGGGNSNSPYNRDYVVLHNKESVPVDLGRLKLQYSSASGSFPVLDSYKHALSGTIAAGGYYLVALAGGSAGDDLPIAADETGNINLAAGSGIVALVRDYLISGDTPDSPKVLDLVGYSNTAALYKGSGPAPAPNNTRAIIRKEEGCRDTDDNKADFETCAPFPMNSESLPHNCAED